MNKKKISIYSAGLLQGIALVSFPASSTILTDPHTYHFTSTQYGTLFIPQALLSIITALLNPIFCKYFGAKRTLTCGLIANFLSMSLLASTVLIMNNQNASYFILLVATSWLGIGFGTVVPTLNRMTEELSPTKSDQAVLTLNALLGVGTALAPLFIAFFSFIGIWWGLPVCIALALLILLLYNFKITLPEEKNPKITSSKGITPWIPLSIFATFALLYGVIETLNSTWISIYMQTELHASITIQSIALTAFWGMLTFGRILFALLSKFFSQKIPFQIAPFIAASAFLLIAYPRQELWAVFIFGLMGFGCSIILPLLISFGDKKLKSVASAVPGMIISLYLLGYGVAAFGVGPLEEYGYISLKAIYRIGALLALILGALSFYIVHTKKKSNHGDRS